MADRRAAIVERSVMASINAGPNTMNICHGREPGQSNGSVLRRSTTSAALRRWGWTFRLEPQNRYQVLADADDLHSEVELPIRTLDIEEVEECEVQAVTEKKARKLVFARKGEDHD